MIARVPVRICWAALYLATLGFAIFVLGMGSLAARAQEKPALRVTAVGDVRITRRFAADKLAEIRKIKLSGDIIFGNFEGVLAESDSPDPWKFSAPMVSIGLLKEMGFNAFSLANNHSADLGDGNYQKTAALLAQQGFWVAGQEGHGVIAEVGSLRLRAVVPFGSGTGVPPVNGHGQDGRATPNNTTTHVRIIGFSFSGANNINNLDAIPAVIGRKQREVIIVSAHMGGDNHTGQWIPNAMEYFGDEKRGDVVQFSHRCIDAGADLVLGHSPHVPRGLELYKNKLIVYSLGNFLFDYPGAGRNAHALGYAISIDLDETGDFQSARIVSYDLQYGVPVPDRSGRAYKMIQNLTLENLKQTSLVFPESGIVRKIN
jgi:poly-gamma-glutamate capsule biosynthesis protein CapA/YwtB (metallophosphatase superfamily)